MKRFWPVLIWIGYAVLLGWLRYRTALVWWGLGMSIAALLFLVDRLLYVWWLKPYEQLSIQVHYWWNQKDYLAACRLLVERGNEQARLVLKSGGFSLVWPILTVYVITSTGSVTAAGIVMGLGLGLAMAIVADWKDLRTLKQWFCWQIKREVTDTELRTVTGIYLALWGLISVLIAMR